jgi:hypothetical protein
MLSSTVKQKFLIRPPPFYFIVSHPQGRVKHLKKIYGLMNAHSFGAVSRP